MPRSVLNDEKVPNDYWAEVVAIGIHILNISPTKTMRNINPYEEWFSRKPNVSHSRVFGCKHIH